MKLSDLTPKIAESLRLQRYGSKHDGGYILSSAHLHPDTVCYSYGIGNNIDFENALIEIGAVFAFDPTISARPANAHPRINFTREPASAEMLPIHLNRHGHATRQDLLLKMDIEGAEYQTITQAPKDFWQHFGQITIEIHDCRLTSADTQVFLRRLTEHHQIIHLHGNNYSSALDGLPVTLELTLLRHDLMPPNAQPATDAYPIPNLDSPNDPKTPDIRLDWWVPPASFDSEADKYRHIYSQPHAFPGYKNTFHGAAFVKECSEPGTCVLDIGCGHNEFAQALRTTPGVHALGVDFACPDADITASVTSLPFADKAFHLATAFDVLEHLLPIEVAPALQEISRVSERFLFTICTRPSYITVSGQNLHPTVQPMDWWSAQIQAAGGTITTDQTSIAGYWAETTAVGTFPWQEAIKSTTALHAYILGKGPTLDQWINAGRPCPPDALLIGVNHAAAVAPCQYAVTSHPELAALGQITGPRWIVARPCRSTDWPSPAWAWSSFWHTSKNHDHLLTLSPDQLARTQHLWGTNNSGNMAIHLARILGAQSITLVGMDGDSKYAEAVAKISEPINVRNLPTGRFAKFKTSNQTLAERLFGSRWGHWGPP